MLEGRATATCSLGPLIRADIAAADALQGTGVIRHRGSCELLGLYTPAAGTVVTFTWTDQQGVTRNIPHKMRVMSSFANPLRYNGEGSTTVELGCLLTYLSDRKPPLKNPTAKEENADVPCDVFRRAALPVSAQYVFNQCLSALGISASGANLTNTFAIEEFDLSGGYVNAISDLLVSECQVGELDYNETLQVTSTLSEGGSGSYIRKQDILDIGPIGSGQLPGDAVVVRYTSRKLKAPEEVPEGDPEQEEAKQNWEYSSNLTEGPEIDISEGIDENAGAVKLSYRSYSRTDTVTTYDILDRVIRRETTTTQPLGAINGQMMQSAYLPTTRSFNAGNTGVTLPGDQWTRELIDAANDPVESLEVEITTYKYPAPEAGDEAEQTAGECQATIDDALDKVPDLSVVLQTETLRYESDIQCLASTQFKNYLTEYSNGNNPLLINRTPTNITQRTVVTFEPQPFSFNPQRYGVRDVVPGTVTSTEVTKTVTRKWLAYMFTQQGQQMNATRAYASITMLGNTDRIDFGPELPAAFELIPQEVTEDIVIGREFGLQQRPTAADRSNAPAANATDEPIEEVTGLAWVSGSSSSESVTEFTLPLAPDDRISWNPSTGYSSTPSDAQTKARNYGRVQNRLLLGNRYGMELQLTPTKLPPLAFSPIYLSIDGLVGQYRVNNASWVITPGEVVCGCNAMFWGAVGTL